MPPLSLSLSLSLSLVCVRGHERKPAASMAHLHSLPPAPNPLGPRFHLTISTLPQGNLALVHGAMRFLTEFTHEFDQLQIPTVLPMLMPELYKVFADPQYACHIARV